MVKVNPAVAAHQMILRSACQIFTSLRMTRASRLPRTAKALSIDPARSDYRKHVPGRAGNGGIGIHWKQECRRTRPAIPIEVVELFRRASELRDARLSCVDSDFPCSHALCTEYDELWLALHRELLLKPWDESPLDTGDDELRRELLT